MVLKARSFKLLFFLTAVLLAVCGAWLFPHVTDLDAYRPQITAQMEKILERKVSIGSIRARIFPQPGLIATDVTLHEPREGGRAVVTVSRVIFSFHYKSLLRLKPRLKTIDFDRPKILLKREGASWVDFYQQISIPRFDVQPDTEFPLKEILVQNGQAYLTDHVAKPPLRYQIEGISGAYQVGTHQGVFRSHMTLKGRKSTLRLIFAPQLNDALTCELRGFPTAVLSHYLPAGVRPLSGSVDMDVLFHRLSGDLRDAMTLEIRRLDLAMFPKLFFQGTLIVTKDGVQATIDSRGAPGQRARAFMRVSVSSGTLKGDGSIDALPAGLIRPLTSNRWLSRLYSTGRINVSLSWPLSSGNPELLLKGAGVHLTGLPWEAREVTVIRDPRGISVEGSLRSGRANARVTWKSFQDKPYSQLRVDVNHTAVRQILEIFDLQERRIPSERNMKPGSLRVHGYERFRVDDGYLDAKIYPGRSFDIVRSRITCCGGDIEVKGAVYFRKKPSQMVLRGALHNMNASKVVTELFYGKPILSGTGGFQVDLRYPCTKNWYRNLNGTVTGHVENGVIYSFKTFYKVLSIINLTNLLTGKGAGGANGIPFQGISGNVVFKEGVLLTEDLFLNSNDMKVAGKGQINFREKTIHAVLNVQVLRFIENLITSIPGIRWMFKGGHKILLPMPVTLEGPLDNIGVNR